MQVDHILMRDRVYYTHFPLLHKFRKVTLTLLKEILRIEDKDHNVEESSKRAVDAKQDSKSKPTGKDAKVENVKSQNQETGEKELTTDILPVVSEDTRLIRAYDRIDLEDTRLFALSQKLDILHINNFKEEAAEDQQ